MMDVTIYSTPTCPWCKKVKDFLKENNVIFEEVNVAGNQEAAQKMIKVSGQMGVPVVVAGEEVIIGFDENALRNALKL